MPNEMPSFKMTGAEKEILTPEEKNVLQKKLDDANKNLNEINEPEAILEKLRNEKLNENNKQFIKDYGLEEIFEEYRKNIDNFTEEENRILTALKEFVKTRAGKMDEKHLPKLKESVIKLADNLLKAA